MTGDAPKPHGGVGDELRPYVDRHELDAINSLGERLGREREFPAESFRSTLRASLADRAPERAGLGPSHLRVLITACAASGLVLLAIASIGLAGIGPLSA